MTIQMTPHGGAKIEPNNEGTYHFDMNPQHNFKMYGVKTVGMDTRKHHPTAQEAYDALWRQRCDECDGNPDAQNVIQWVGQIVRLKRLVRNADGSFGPEREVSGYIGSAELTTGRARRRPTK